MRKRKIDSPVTLLHILLIHLLTENLFEPLLYVVLFTTVNRHKLKKSDVMELYLARWQVELSFRRLKGIMNLGHLHKSDPESCKEWLYGKIFVALLVERIMREADSFSPWG